MAVLMSWPWPGNVRELRNVLERGAVVAKGNVVQAGDLGLDTATSKAAAAGAGGTLEDVEHRYIALVLEDAGGNVSQAARILDIDRVTLYAKIKKYGLHKAGD
jgi:transcriptional regulator of acetoin/glycerol metabolism